MSFSDGHKFSGESIAHIARIIDSIHLGIWEYNTDTRQVKWSPGFYTALGYKPGEIECSYNYFFEHLLYYHDKQAFLASTHHTRLGNSPVVHIRLLTKQNGYQWFESTTQKHDTADGPLIYGVLSNINALKVSETKVAEKELKCAEIGRIAKIGSWEIDAATMALRFSKETYNIFELDAQPPITVPEAISFFEPQYRQVLTAAIENAIKYSKPYDIEVLFKTARNNVIWVRCKGVPVLDDYGNCIILRGIFQDIDSIKKKGITLQSSLNLLDDQNKRLQNFAYIVSHNLRSHAGNLKFMVNLFEESHLQDDRTEIFSHIKTISESLSATMGHLDEIVKIQSEISKGRKVIDFETIYNNVESVLHTNIANAGAQINIDFAGCPQIDYIPAYLESIFQNLLTNAIKYKHPDRNPVININTHKIGHEVYLVFEDNGIGIDLKRYGDELFGMYKTFHHNQDAKGIGLFITRNQVEALGGSIQVDSAVNVGTKFTIKLV
ncbi:PAS domain-containing sensor histidine kinase [Mucilaginibacter sp. AK015]|uniref:PAS domain-containing sensor histidine kinase n=1 Tax=Mucilaginibacter sp. AK015 TaxID=2723072 RepID=UPI00161FE925|nr:PAS domain-containing sensor histidine kinase [Mucilaginibacter sp. AK015]MBB5395921.1 signal transduction histidine kinase [Mucilaginibacter sp. AK015]